MKDVCEIQSGAGNGGERIAVDRAREYDAVTVSFHPVVQSKIAELCLHTDNDPDLKNYVSDCTVSRTESK